MSPFDFLGGFQFLFWPLLILFAFLLVAVGIGALLFGGRERDLSVYQKRKFLFDTRSEFELFNLLIELYADRYYVFPQVHYSHIIEVSRRISYRERFGYWNSINRKSADFVLCDKQMVVPQLVIELDGTSHDRADRQARDEFINRLMAVTGLPICHLKTGNRNREFVRAEIDRALQANQNEPGNAT